MSEEEIIILKSKAKLLEETLLETTGNDVEMNKAIGEYAFELMKNNGEEPIVCYQLYIMAVEKQLELLGVDYVNLFPQFYAGEQ